MKSINEAYTTLGDPQKENVWYATIKSFYGWYGGMGSMHGEGMPVIWET